MTVLSELVPRWSALSALLDEALDLPAAQRAAWLEQLRGPRAECKDTLRRLLDAHAQVDAAEVLNTLPRLRIRPDASELRAGTSIGPYRLISELGLGGMGAVWLAVRSDGQLKRHVALKLPRMAWGGNLHERLARERDILASLTHVNIARLYDAGVDQQGRPYLAMEHVEGQPIDVHCRERSLPLRARIDLLLQVCDAVAHAHSRLVVHRDLKPSNILVTAHGQVRLLDFGIAKLLEGHFTADTALTQHAGRTLTLDYASPEQIRGEPLGTASDVYSLAVVAYELLSAARPYRLKRGSAAELEEAIASADPPLASESAADPSAIKSLRGDLDAILNKALKKDSRERYPTIEALAQDLQRHLDQQPVQAQADRLGYRAGKFMRRHRLQVTATGVAVIALVAGAGVALWQAREARLQAARAQSEAATAQAVQGFIEAVFRANSGDQADPQKARDTTARQLLDLGAERIDSELRVAPEARLRLLKTLADMYQGMALHDKAVALHRQRVALTRQTHGAQSASLAQALADFAYTIGYTDKRKQAHDAVSEAGAILDALGDRDSPQRFSVDLTLGFLFARTDFEQGLAAADRAVANARSRAAWPDLVRALQVQGEISTYSGQHDKARAAALEAIRFIEYQPALGANSLSPTLIMLGEAQLGLGELGAADASFRKALALARTHNAVAPIFIHTAERIYANFLRRNGRFRESLAVSQPAYVFARAAKGQFGVMPPSLVADHARVLIAYGHVEEGLAALDEAAALLAGMDDAPEVTSGIDLFRAQGLLEQGRYAQADAALARAELFYSSSKLRPSPLVAATRHALQTATGAADAALRSHQADRIQRGLPAVPLASETPRALTDSARLHLHANLTDAAREQAGQAITAVERHRFRDQLPAVEAEATAVLGQALLRQSQSDAARATLERSLALHREVYDPTRSLAVADVLLALAQAQRQSGDAAAAARALAEVRRIHAGHVAVGEHHLAAWRMLAAADESVSSRSRSKPSGR